MRRLRHAAIGSTTCCCRRTRARRPRSLDDDVTTVVRRYRRDSGRAPPSGGLYAGREGEGLPQPADRGDLFWRPNQSDTLRVQYIRSEHAYPGAVSADFAQPTGAFGGNAVVDPLPARQLAGIRPRSMATVPASAATRVRAACGLPHLLAEGQRRGRPGRRVVVQPDRPRHARLADDDCDWTLTDQTVAAFVNYTGPYQTQAQFNMPRDIVVYRAAVRVLAAELLCRHQAARAHEYPGVRPVRRRRRLHQRRKAHAGSPVRPALSTARRRVNLRSQLQPRPICRWSGGRLYRANLTQLKPCTT